MEIKYRYIVGCHIMFYEIDMITEYIDSLVQWDYITNKENITRDLFYNMSQYFEKMDTDKVKKHEFLIRFKRQVARLESLGFLVEYEVYDDDETPYTMSDYRRDLNYKSVNSLKYDYTIWCESDCLLPKEMLPTLDHIMDNSPVPRYIVTFAIRKMWDDSWRVLEHPKFTDSPFYEMADPKALTEDSSIRNTMSLERMNEINSETDGDLSVYDLNFPKFDGSGLVMTNQLLMTGCNIPKSVFMNGDDTAFLESVRLHMGNQYKQYVVKNILKVHNRNHPNKRFYVKGEDDTKQSHFKRQTNWYKEFNVLSKGNLNNLYHNQKRFLTYEDFRKTKT